MAPITELILLPLNPSITADTVSTVLATNTARLLASPGCLRVRASRVHEDPGAKQRLFVDWTSTDAHHAFVADPAVFAPFAQSMRTIIDPAVPRGKPFHVLFDPFPPAVLDNKSAGARSPVAELLHVYFPGGEDGYAEDKVQQSTETVRLFLEKLLALDAGCTGETALGWSLERDVEFKGEPCRVLVVSIGWSSVEAHMKARGHEEFPKIIPLLRNLEGLKGMELCHVSNTTTESSN
ncbi:hypothetical protein F4677DRAFT_414990 [Hypoxylon crocopeplum]|nr:hypothetical protein F4677DRAFT_414990 [Hypoxylon crocopeplum]